MSFQRLVVLILVSTLCQLKLAVADLDCSADLTPCLLPADADDNPTGKHICRERFNVAYLERVATPLCVKMSDGKEGDECGCCNGGCPEPCFEPCLLSRDPYLEGVYVYDWWSFWPRRFCESKGQTLKRKQMNAARWSCVPPEGLFGFHSLFSFDDGESVASFSPFD